MATYLIILLYALCGLYVGRRAAGYIMWTGALSTDYNGRRRIREPRGEDKAWAFLTFVAATSFWPIVVGGTLWTRHSKAILPKPAHVLKEEERIERKRIQEVLDREEAAQRTAIEQWSDNLDD